MDVVLGILLIATLVAMVVGFVVSSWRSSERQHQHWQSRRGQDQPASEQPDDRGASRSHWGGMGRPGGGGY